MGSCSKEITPQANSRMAITTTRNRLFSAKSTRLRIMKALLFDRVLQDQRVRYQSLAGLDSRHDLLHVVGQHRASGYLHAPEPAALHPYVDPVAVVQVNHRRARDRRAHLLVLAVERRVHEHTDAH